MSYQRVVHLTTIKVITFMVLLILHPLTGAESPLPPGGPKPSSTGHYPWDSKPHHLSAEACKDCHQEIYQQWKSSIHAHSTALSDPIHEAFYRKVAGDPRQEGVTLKSGKYPVCLKCHAPNAALDQVTKLDAQPTYQEGVNCITCHILKAFNGVQTKEGKFNLGIDAYEFASVLQGPSGKIFTQESLPSNPLGVDIATPSYHPYPMESNTTLLRTTEVCLGCHERRNNSHGVPLCVTGDEFEQSENFNCQQCHMPVNNGYADHTMAGGHVQAMLERAVILTLATTKQGDFLKTEVTLINTLPHNMPTGAPFRTMHVKLTAYNAEGQPLWWNFRDNQGEEDPQSLFRLTLLDDQDQSVPPPKAKKLGKDTRLQPNETRVLRYSIPSQSVTTVRAQLYYDLLWPSLKQQFTSIPAELKIPKVIARAEQRI